MSTRKLKDTAGKKQRTNKPKKEKANQNLEEVIDEKISAVAKDQQEPESEPTQEELLEKERSRAHKMEDRYLRANAEFENSISPEEATEILSKTSGVTLCDVPTPIDCTGIDDTLVGRLRKNETVENGLDLSLSGDNLRQGAALNAIQIEEELLKR